MLIFLLGSSQFSSELTLPCILVYDKPLREREGLRLAQSRSEIVAWVASNVIPHEAALRSRLQWMAVSGEEIDDIVQDAYLNIARLQNVTHIRDGRAYLFSTARMVVLQRIRRNRIVTIDSLSVWTGTEAGPRKISARLLEVNGKRYEVGVTIGAD